VKIENNSSIFKGMDDEESRPRAVDDPENIKVT
jgi:hypothetical protein